MKKFFRHTFVLIWTISVIVLLSSKPVLSLSSSKGDYIVGPGDILQIQVWDNDDLNRTIELSQQGSFTFPFVGKVKAANLTVFQIEKLLTRRLSDGYLVAPQVNITVSEYQNQKVFLFGEIKRPGSFILKRRSHLMELISEAGGFTEQRGSACVIVRPEARTHRTKPISIHDAKKSEIIEINIDKLISGAADTPAFYIQPGDSIYIGESEKIYVTGEVRLPGKLNWKKGLTVREAVSLAGGGTARASVNRIRIIRNKNGVEKMIKPKLNDPVLPNDIIKVPESFF
ncbi:MAG: hypothetical protein GY874_02510 [Desulfobacteraceae bacterium]|nr:hypothetical protein [Desulfobacteraceae bacterium]